MANSSDPDQTGSALFAQTCLPENVGSFQSNFSRLEKRDFERCCTCADIKKHCLKLPLHTIGPGHTKTCLMPYANNKDADQPAHPRSLISTFVVRCLDSMICIPALPKVSRFYLVSVAEQAGLNLTWSKIPEDTFSRDIDHIMCANRSDSGKTARMRRLP